MNAIPGGPFGGESAQPDVKATLMEALQSGQTGGESSSYCILEICCTEISVSLKTGRDIGTTIFESFEFLQKLGGMATLVH